MLTCTWWTLLLLYSDVIVSAMASQITSLSIVCWTVCSGADAFAKGVHRWLVNSPHKGPVTRKMLQFDDVIMDHDLSLTPPTIRNNTKTPPINTLQWCQMSLIEYRLLVQQLVRVTRNKLWKPHITGSLWEGSTGHQWIAPTNGQ